MTTCWEKCVNQLEHTNALHIIESYSILIIKLIVFYVLWASFWKYIFQKRITPERNLCAFYAKYVH